MPWRALVASGRQVERRKGPGRGAEGPARRGAPQGGRAPGRQPALEQRTRALTARRPERGRHAVLVHAANASNALPLWTQRPLEDYPAEAVPSASPALKDPDRTCDGGQPVADRSATRARADAPALAAALEDGTPRARAGAGACLQLGPAGPGVEAPVIAGLRHGQTRGDALAIVERLGPRATAVVPALVKS